MRFEAMLSFVLRALAPGFMLAGAIGAAVTAASAATSSAQVEIKADLDRTDLKAGERQTAYLRIVIGTARRPDVNRAPMNIALVIDRSGSMSGYGRIENARRAAQMAVERLGRNDILSVVSYDDRIDVEVPATKVTSPERIKERIERLTPRGSTAIHAGLLVGANEIRKFKSSDRVNRIILLSDGLANVGPSKPSDFVSLGRELASEGITVSTIGLGSGYNEDLMAGLARAADGSHAFVQESADLAGFLAREFDDALGIVGQQVEIIITLKDGVKPMRAMGRDAEIRDNRLVYKVGALFGGAEQVLLAELDVGALAVQDASDIARIELSYSDAASGKRVSAAAAASARFVEDRELSEKSVNPIVVRDVATLQSREARQEAIRLRDAGRADEAKRKFEDNAAYVRAQQDRLPAPARKYAPLEAELKANETAAAPAAQSKEEWQKQRKLQRQYDSNSSGAAVKY
jgi:Ca-activated chloride channel family protein